MAGILVDFNFQFGFSIFVFLLGLTYAGIYWVDTGAKLLKNFLFIKEGNSAIVYNYIDVYS